MERSPPYKTTNLTREQIKALASNFPLDILAEVLAEKLGASPSPTPQTNRQWYNTDPAYERLGLNSPEQLRRLKRRGLFRPGVDYRIVGSEFQFHITNCLARLAELPEKRRIFKNQPRSRRGKPSTT
ncbi:hypothetical protein ACE1AT_12630 [Pelatocladus sp. BLCC-F211]|uniref:hypothetical protein n=1 Tax=Pelatocladus sp. BLCC-F211 TaxID=3342752 RepID=UPI0035BA03D3